MTADELLVVIRRDIGQQIQMALQFRTGDHIAHNIKMAREVSIVITDWLDSLMKNKTSDDTEIYQSDEVWADRAYCAEAKLDKIKEILS